MATEAPKGHTTIEIPVEREGRRGPSRTRGLTRSTGPKTLRGKRKSRYNALKHGIFAVGVLPRRESYSDYQAHFESMIESLQPVGRLEELLVEKLAMLFWRYRRLIGAEAALATNEADRIEGIEVRRQMRDGCVGDEEGLLHKAIHADNPYATMVLVKRLEEIRGRIEEGGLDWNRDQELLMDTFGFWDSGDAIEPQRTALVKRYRELTFQDDGEDNHVGESEGSRVEGKPSSLKAKQEILDMVAHHLELFAREVLPEMLRKGEEEQLSAIAALVPRDDLGDRLQRYEGTLERGIDRTLSQLERLQRHRIGLPILPTLKVDVSRD